MPRDRPSLRVVPPFRLDLTVVALQRLPTNPVEVWTEDGRYLRAFSRGRPRVWEVSQSSPGALRLVASPSQIALVRRMLGTDVDLAPFYAAVRTPALRRLVRAFEGVKPPRFASLWESFVNAVAFQQLSLAAGMAAVRRLVLATTDEVVHRGVALHPFPSAETVADFGAARLRECGFSTVKARSLHALATQVADGLLREDELEKLPTDEAIRFLRELPGIGPWTADLVLLRGLRRLDVFPGGDAGAARGFARLFPGTPPAALLDELGPWRGMLYFHLLLASRFGLESS